MNIEHVILSGAFGAIVASGLTYLCKKNKINKVVASIIFIIVIALMNLGYGKFYSAKNNTKNDRAEIETALQKIPLFQTFKEQDPFAYVQFKEGFIALIRQGKSQQEIIDLMQVESMKLISQRVSYAPDSNVINMANDALEEMVYLEKNKNDQCFKYLFPYISGGINTTKVLPPELLQQDLNTKNELFIASYHTPIIADEQANRLANEDLAPIYDQMVKVYGDDVQMLANPESPNIDRQKVCQMAIKFYGEILLLPQDKAARILRMMLGSQ